MLFLFSSFSIICSNCPFLSQQASDGGLNLPLAIISPGLGETIELQKRISSKRGPGPTGWNGRWRHYAFKKWKEKAVAGKIPCHRFLGGLKLFSSVASVFSHTENFSVVRFLWTRFYHLCFKRLILKKLQMFELGRVVARICRHNFTRAQSIVCKHGAFLRKWITSHWMFILLIYFEFPFHHPQRPRGR